LYETGKKIRIYWKKTSPRMDTEGTRIKKEEEDPTPRHKATKDAERGIDPSL